IIILIVVALIALAFLVDAVRNAGKRKKEPGVQGSPKRIVTADEAGPTETGRFRAQQALGRASSNAEPETPSRSAGVDIPTESFDDEDAPLPDPFENEK